MDVNAFLKMLPYAGKGMLGIFIVTAVIILLIKLLVLFTRNQKED